MSTLDQVRALLLEGLTDKQIAQRTGKHYGTVKYHVRRILDQTGAANRTEAAVRLIHRENVRGCN